MRQLSDCVDGMSEACRAFGIPVVGGNVSLYNESRGRDIDPTPVVGVVGLIGSLERRPPIASVTDGAHLVLLGDESATNGTDALAGSFWADQIHGHRGGRLPALDLDALRRLVDLLVGLVPTGIVTGIHDVSDGGLGGCLAELVARSGMGVLATGVAGHAQLFSEAGGRVVVATADPAGVEAVATAGGVAARRLGTAGGDRLVIDRLVDVPADEVCAVWRATLPTQLG
jgi:phosphoribosylformylglycinamidine synthase